MKEKRFLISGSYDKTIKVWDLVTKKCLRTITAHTEAVLFIKHIRENIVASASQDGSIKLWDISNGSCVHTFESAHKRHIYR